VLKVVLDTNIWIRALLGGRVTLPVLEAWRAGRFQVLISEPLLAELEEVCQRPRLKKHITREDAQDLLDLLRWSAIQVEPTTIPPQCRDPKDHPFLATAIDGGADALISGDSDLRGDDQLREEMAAYGVELWGVESLLRRLDES
jgi:putative PIN family toxin of toxin-antitoxin system